MISVLMSIYNETESELRESISSILSQTYSDFEFVIVNDNPANALIRTIVSEFCNLDSRIVYSENKENIGLAMSLNRAASISKGQYLLRMDADDISYPERFDVELRSLLDGNYDLVCSGYDVIDENSRVVDYNCGLYSDSSLRSIIPYEIAIHHPTVLMRRDKFEEIGGYRNFKCAQDYDLWLRMWNANYRIHQIPRSLIKYRIRKTSTTSQKKYLQKCTIDYIIKLFHERIIYGADTYEYDKYLGFVNELGANDQKKTEKFMKQHFLLSTANQKITEGKRLRGLLMRTWVFMTSKSYRHSYMSKFKTKKLIRGYESGSKGFN